MSTVQVTQLPARPDNGGTLGRPMRVGCNFYPLNYGLTGCIYHYSTEVLPDVPPPVAREVFMAWEAQHASELRGASPVYDGRANTYAPQKLFFGKESTFQVDVPERGGGGGGRRPPREFKIKLFLVAEVGMEELHRFLQGKSALTSSVPIQALDIVLRHALNQKYTTVGRSIYSGDIAFNLGGGVEAWQGYYQSVRPARGALLVNVDVSATVFYRSGPLLDVIAEFFGLRSPKELRDMGPREIFKVQRFVRGLKIRVTHRRDFKPKYTLQKVSSTPASHTMFAMEDGTEKSVEQYFHEKYNFRLSYPYLPCVIVGKGANFPMEVCEVEPKQRCTRKLDEQQTASMIKFTTQRPNDRLQKIKAGMSIFEYEKSPAMQAFKMRVGNELLQVNSRVLPTPKVNYHPSSREASLAPRLGAWNLRDKRVTRGAQLRSWSVLVLAPPRSMGKPQVEGLVREMCIVFNDTGLEVVNRQPPLIPGNPQDTAGSLREAYNAAGNQAKAEPQIVVVILMNSTSSIYSEVKRTGETLLGIPTQCLLMRNVMRPSKQYLANVCLKVNVKLGGANQVLSPEHMPFLRQTPTIVIGADVSHPAPGGRSASITGLVASLNPDLTRFFSVSSTQESRVEVIDEMEGMVKEALKAFYGATRMKPARILFYRDGVGEGQFAEVLQKEVGAIKRACASLEKGYDPKITFSVVQKRHHVRFFPLNRDMADRSGNCLPGTVVDTTIVHPFEYDFYIQSHSGIQGMSRPSHYHVLLDENKLGSNVLQQMTYDMCYLYARCTRSVSLVPVAYYAHLVADRHRRYAKGEWDGSDTQSEVSFSSVDAPIYSDIKEGLRQRMYFM
ncbi:Piwi domain-containing protein [Piptocephalis cylindrospora]|uniref:Piwi domain-containing protein n=1 Tax=Piptocephalis cylindrospora TaxID=1907219 RepID=A0A4P9Y9C2_9FUNG|nr:Piwi domain-containing protein [Piptocephalis cylindrospora]|eukprot:RKP15011.1 Piwi domain-containing protein [Piptocephalis cylindrospora]